MPNNAEIGVVYLARFAEGTAPIRNFVNSWRSHSPGIACDLIVVWKGFPDCRYANTEHYDILSEIEHRSITMSDRGYDLTAYKFAARVFTPKYLCFLNTFSMIEADNWLSFMYDAISLPRAGMVGATGSFESIGHSMKLMNRDVFYCCMGARYNRELANRWRPEIEKHAPKWLQRGWRSYLRRFHRRFVAQTPYPSRAVLDSLFEQAWTEPGKNYAQFPHFPNPHIRSNAFMIERERFLDLTPSEMLTKDECYEYESGYTGLSRKIVALGLLNLVVGADGVAYPENMWPNSFTFRRGRQQNKLVSDNQTRGFEEMTPARRKVLEEWSWGDGTLGGSSPPPTNAEEYVPLPNPHDPLPISPGMFA